MIFLRSFLRFLSRGGMETSSSLLQESGASIGCTWESGALAGAEDNDMAASSGGGVRKRW